MNLGQNKFYIGFGAFMLLATGALGWFLFQASSDFSEADAKYQDQVTQLGALQSLPLYPETSNLKILEEQKDAAQVAVVSLHQALVPRAFALEPMTPEQFQDKLNEAVKAIEDKAAKAGVQFADKFYLGFAQYRAATPKPEAAAVLGRQLKCIALVVNTLIDKKVISIGEIVREPLPEEGVASKTQPQSAPQPVAKGKDAAVPLVSKFPFKVTFVSNQQPFQSALNELSKSEQQFFIIRPLLIKNQVEKPPKRIDPEAERLAAAEKQAALNNTQGTTPAPGATPEATPKSEPLKYVLGAEKINVTLRLDSVFFASNLPK
jgi:hypothetical protein